MSKLSYDQIAGKNASETSDQAYRAERKCSVGRKVTPRNVQYINVRAQT